MGSFAVLVAGVAVFIAVKLRYKHKLAKVKIRAVKNEKEVIRETLQDMIQAQQAIQKDLALFEGELEDVIDVSQ